VAEWTRARAVHGIAPEQFQVPVPGQTGRL
jgi:hypothetical protein